MKSVIRSLAMLAAGLLVAALAQAAPPELVPGEILVRFRELPRTGRLATGPGGEEALVMPLAPLRRSAPGSLRDQFSRTVRIRVAPGADPAAVAAAWRTRADVEWAGPVHLIPLVGAASASVAPLPAAKPDFTPDDPLLAGQWHHDAIGSYAAWDRSAGDSSVVIAIVDTGADLGNDDLAPNLWRNAAEARGLPGVDDDGNGYVDDIVGYDFTDVPEIDGAGDFKDRDSDPSDDVGHGTWVAGAAAAVGNNAIGGAGVAWRCRMMILRAGFRPRSGFSLGFLAEDDAAAAVIYAVENGAAVINLSFGDVTRAPVLEDAVRFAVESGAVVVAAAGNSGTGESFYPADLSGVLAVGASNRDGRRASFSTWGPAVQLLAPGASILTTELGGGSTAKSGTSLAAPIASGGAAILRAIHPQWSGEQVVAALLGSARSGASDPDAHGASFLDLATAVDEPAGAVIRIAAPDDGSAWSDELLIRGSVGGAMVRGFRVLARRDSESGWRTLAQGARRVAVEETLAVWNLADEPEGGASVRVEALGLSGVVLAREARFTIDHTPPVLSSVEAFPVISLDGYGLRVTAQPDEPCLASIVVTSGGAHFEERDVATVDAPILGLDGPLPFATGDPVQVELSCTNLAGLTTTRTLPVLSWPVGGPAAAPDVQYQPAPVVSTWMPVIRDLNGDGVSDLVAESPPETPVSYGALVAFNVSGNAGTGDGSMRFDTAWESDQTGIPRDAADFDGDGRMDLLVLGLQEARVYSSPGSGGFPTRQLWKTSEAWGCRFIPAPDGPGSDIVATRDTEIRIYRRDGENLALRQTVANPTPGGNSVSTDIALLHDGNELSLATIDSDNDLFVVTRDAEGHFLPRWNVRLSEDYLTLIAAPDLDGDGRSELAVVEGVGGIPSPAVGLRDGFYRLLVYRGNADGSFAPWLDLAARGYFPGNSVSLDAADLDGDGRDEIWWGIGREHYQVVYADGRLVLGHGWPSGTVGQLAAGVVVPADGSPDRRVVLFPGRPGGGSAADYGRAYFPSPAGTRTPAIVDLRVSGAQPLGARIGIHLAWSGAAPGGYTVTRADSAISPGIARTWRVMVPALDDTLPAGDAIYRYSVAAGTAPASASIDVIPRLSNPIESARIERGSLVVTWRHPVAATERSTLTLDPADRASVMIDRGGRRLVARPEHGFAAGGTYRFRLKDYVSDSSLPLAAPDERGEVAAPPERRPLRLVAVQPASATELRLQFEPEAPSGVLPAQIHVEPAAEVTQVLADDARTLRLRLTPPLHTGGFTVRLDPGLSTAAGDTVVPGIGDALAFQVSPVAYPNPVRLEVGRMRFEWLAPGDEVRVFDILGREVWTGRETDGGVDWNLRTSSGATVSPGPYIYRVYGVFGGSGKIAIIR